MMSAHSGGSDAISSLSKKDINIYPEGSTFISDQAIYQWKEGEKNANLDKNTKDSESTCFIPNFSLGLCWEVKFKSKSELPDLITVTVLKANRLWDLKFILIPPPYKA